MDRKNELDFIASDTGRYLETQGLSLEKRLEQINISPEDQKKILKENVLKIGIEKAFSLLGPIGDIINTVIDWNEKVNEDLSDAKKAILLNQYFLKADDHENAINQLKSLLINPQGNTIFNKILRLLDSSPPDPELSEHLSSALKNIIREGNFEELFEQHRYALSQIERLTPQALTIINDYQNWPPIHLGTSINHGPKVTSDFHEEFTRAYCTYHGVGDARKYKRVQHSVIELQSQGFMEAFNTDNHEVRCILTDIGHDLLAYIK